MKCYKPQVRKKNNGLLVEMHICVFLNIENHHLGDANMRLYNKKEMEDKFQKKYRVSSPRLTGWDYGSHGLYFVTICTKDRVPYLGEINQLPNEDRAFFKHSDIGLVAEKYWLRLPDFYKYVKLDDFVFMPDHLHAILFIDKPDKTSWEMNKFGVQKDNLAAILRGYMASLKKHANENDIEFGWQPRYYDRVIRDQREYENVQQYIYDNPDNWLAKREGFENLYF